jgi:hypothetical protein
MILRFFRFAVYLLHLLLKVLLVLGVRKERRCVTHASGAADTKKLEA